MPPLGGARGSPTVVVRAIAITLWLGGAVREHVMVSVVSSFICYEANVSVAFGYVIRTILLVRTIKIVISGSTISTYYKLPVRVVSTVVDYMLLCDVKLEHEPVRP